MKRNIEGEAFRLEGPDGEFDAVFLRESDQMFRIYFWYTSLGNAYKVLSVPSPLVHELKLEMTPQRVEFLVGKCAWKKMCVTYRVYTLAQVYAIWKDKKRYASALKDLLSKLSIVAQKYWSRIASEDRTCLEFVSNDEAGGAMLDAEVLADDEDEVMIISSDTRRKEKSMVVEDEEEEREEEQEEQPEFDEKAIGHVFLLEGQSGDFPVFFMPKGTELTVVFPFSKTIKSLSLPPRFCQKRAKKASLKIVNPKTIQFFSNTYQRKGWIYKFHESTRYCDIGTFASGSSSVKNRSTDLLETLRDFGLGIQKIVDAKGFSLTESDKQALKFLIELDVEEKKISGKSDKDMIDVDNEDEGYTSNKRGLMNEEEEFEDDEMEEGEEIQQFEEEKKTSKKFKLAGETAPHRKNSEISISEKKNSEISLSNHQNSSLRFVQALSTATAKGGSSVEEDKSKKLHLLLSRLGEGGLTGVCLWSNLSLSIEWFGWLLREKELVKLLPEELKGESADSLFARYCKLREREVKAFWEARIEEEN